MLSYERVGNTLISKTLYLRILLRLAANSLIKIKQLDIVSILYFDYCIKDILFYYQTKSLYLILDPARVSIEASLAIVSILSLPQALLVSENLFYNIKVYFENSYRNMILDNYRTLLTPNSAELYNNLYNDFDLYYFTTTILKEKGLYIEFRYILSKASTLIE